MFYYKEQSSTKSMFILVNKFKYLQDENWDLPLWKYIINIKNIISLKNIFISHYNKQYIYLYNKYLFYVHSNRKY